MRSLTKISWSKILRGAKDWKKIENVTRKQHFAEVKQDHVAEMSGPLNGKVIIL